MVIAGDFNLPVESAIYRQHWGRFRNAFSETGFGAGFTKHTRLFGVRIDHILSSKDVDPVRSFVGKDVGSDHVPLIADFVRPTVSGRVLPGSR
jgi:endonuclease/exonuclease/phosphatase (EEP) superfamily protein YafD